MKDVQSLSCVRFAGAVNSGRKISTNVIPLSGRSGAVEAKGYEPSQKGALIYLNGGDDLGKPLAKVKKAGGKIVFSLSQKSSISFAFLAVLCAFALKN